jgi:hypothetical protein
MRQDHISKDQSDFLNDKFNHKLITNSNVIHLTYVVVNGVLKRKYDDKKYDEELTSVRIELSNLDNFKALFIIRKIDNSYFVSNKKVSENIEDLPKYIIQIYKNEFKNKNPDYFIKINNQRISDNLKNFPQSIKNKF